MILIRFCYYDAGEKPAKYIWLLFVSGLHFQRETEKKKDNKN